ncbi:hypothetical protein BDV19DRAFT_361460 [Aspergillus venezuelensis]
MPRYPDLYLVLYLASPSRACLVTLNLFACLCLFPTTDNDRGTSTLANWIRC